MQKVDREMKIKATNGTEYYLVDVIAQILKYLKIKFIEKHLQRSDYQLEATDFDWVITVPAIWRARGKQLMREAGYKVAYEYINILTTYCVFIVHACTVHVNSQRVSDFSLYLLWGQQTWMIYIHTERWTLMRIQSGVETVHSYQG